MEQDPFEHSGPESSANNDDSTGSSSKKKKKSSRSVAPPEQTVASPEQAKTDKKSEPLEALWHRLLGQEPSEKAAKDEQDKPPTTEVPADETAAEYMGAMELPEVPVESLAPREQIEFTEAYIADRQAELIHEQAESFEGNDEIDVSERAADIALLDSMQDYLRRANSSEQPIDVPLQQAYEATAESLRTAESQREYARASAESERSDSRQTATETAFAVPVRPAVRTEAYEVRAENHTEEKDVHQPNAAAALLIGGAVGYFVGKRRGRVQGEKAVRQVERKLTAEVSSLQQMVANREQKIRTIAREMHTERKAARPAETAGAQSLPFETERAPRSSNETSLPVLEHSERLGIVTLRAAESASAKNTTAEKTKPLVNARHSAAALPRTELLEVGESIAVGATNLRRVYETNLITEEGLRRLVAEHERGGNVQQSLRRELVEKESSFERDPRLRNRKLVGSLAAGGALHQLAASDNAAREQAELAQKADESAAPGNNRGKKNTVVSQTPAYAAAATLIVVIALLLYLLFSGR